MKTHAFTESGLGAAPFHVVGYREMVIRYPDGTVQPSGTCKHCGTGIRHAFVIRSADGKENVVGSSCVKKTGDRGLIDTAKRAKRQAIQEAKARAIAERVEAENAAQRVRNGGLTDEELRIKKLQDARAAAAAIVARYLAHVMQALSETNGAFAASILEDMQVGRLPRCRARTIVCEIYAKGFGRRNSKAYNTAFADAENAFWDCEDKLQETANHD